MNAFCRRVGSVSSGNMSNYINAKRMPTLETLMNIATTADVSLDWLATGRGPKAAGSYPAPQPSALAPDEAALLDNYRNSPDEGKDAIKRTAFALAKSQGMKKGAA